MHCKIIQKLFLLHLEGHPILIQFPDSACYSPVGINQMFLNQLESGQSD